MYIAHGSTYLIYYLFIQNDLRDMYSCPNILIIQFDVGDTALGAAVQNGHLYIAEILVENGADVNYRNKVRALIPVTQVPYLFE